MGDSPSPVKYSPSSWDMMHLAPWPTLPASRDKPECPASMGVSYSQTSVPITVSPLHTNLQVANFQIFERAFHPCKAWVKVQLALRLLLLTILQLYHLPPPLPPPVSNSSCLFTRCQPLYASSCTVLLYFSRYCTVRLKMLSLFFVFVCFLCIICVKSIINLLQYSTK